MQPRLETHSESPELTFLNVNVEFGEVEWYERGFVVTYAHGF